mgnify:CR=1 FL=1
MGVGVVGEVCFLGNIQLIVRVRFGILHKMELCMDLVKSGCYGLFEGYVVAIYGGNTVYIYIVLTVHMCMYALKEDYVGICGITARGDDVIMGYVAVVVLNIIVVVGVTDV